MCPALALSRICLPVIPPFRRGVGRRSRGGPICRLIEGMSKSKFDFGEEEEGPKSIRSKAGSERLSTGEVDSE